MEFASDPSKFIGGKKTHITNMYISGHICIHFVLFNPDNNSLMMLMHFYAYFMDTVKTRLISNLPQNIELKRNGPKI